MFRKLVAIILLFISKPLFADKSGDYEKLEKWLYEFYQGRHRDYPPKVEKKVIFFFKFENSREYIQKKELRGMELVCYELYALEN